jgi:hypothetical protein
VPHRAALDVLEDRAEVFENEVVFLLCTFFCDLAEQLGRLEEIAEPTNGFFLDRRQRLLAVLRALINLVERDPVMLQDLIGEQVHLLRKIFVEDKAQDVVPELIRPHLSPQSVRNIPKLGLKLLFRVGHEEMDRAG